MKVEYINPFIKSTLNLFETMLNEKIVAGNPVVKKEPYPLFDVSAVIGLSGDVTGYVALSFSKSAGLKIASRLIQENLKVVGQVMIDAIGEMANIVAGNAKQYIEGFNILISLPNVVIGKAHKLHSTKESLSLLVPFQSQSGQFALEVAIKENEKK